MNGCFVPLSGFIKLGETMLTIALSINIAVLVPVLIVLLLNDKRAVFAWGENTSGRKILFALYAAILLASASLLSLHLHNIDITAWAQAVLGLQVIYKLLTVPLVGLRNPVVLSNIAIAAFHTATLLSISGGAPAL